MIRAPSNFSSLFFSSARDSSLRAEISSLDQTFTSR